MTFDEIKDHFTEAGVGTDAFRALYKNTFNLMNEDKDNAVIYFLIGVAARAYVLKYDDQAIDTEFAEKSKKTLLEFVERIAQALKKLPDERIKIASEVAFDYHWNITAF